MNKYEVLSFPENIDITNPYLLDEVYHSPQITKVAYSQGMTLAEGQWTYDTDEKAYWISPGVSSSNYRAGYLRISDESFVVLPEDEITVEFELKALTPIADNQKVGVHTDIKTPSNTLISALNFNGDFKVGQYNYCKIKQVVPSHYDAKFFNIIVGTITSTFSTPYQFKIRNIRINIKHNSSVW